MKIKLFFCFYFLSFFLVSCYSPQISLKDQKEVRVYSMKGYLSSRKDQISLDMHIEANLNDDFYLLRGYDTLLGKERFCFFYQKKQWFFQENNQTYLIDSSKNLGDILPAPDFFDYTAFLKGKIPLLKEGVKVRQTEQEEEFQRGDYTQKNYFSPQKDLTQITLFYKEKKIYQFSYEDLLKVGDQFFPKILNIYDYENKRKVVWWLSKVNS